jgi:hypothetical protein
MACREANANKLGRTWTRVQLNGNRPGRAIARVPGAAQHGAISAFTRVFDALWQSGALQTPISGLPEIGAYMRASRASPTCVDRYGT